MITRASRSGCTYSEYAVLAVIVGLTMVLQGCQGPTSSPPEPPPAAPPPAPAAPVERPSPAPPPPESPDPQAFHPYISPPISPETYHSPSANAASLENPTDIHSVNTMPGFPDSPPYPTTFATVPRSLLRLSPTATLGQVGDQLGEALESAGFSRTYYRFLDGFAVVASLEQIDATGHSLPPPDRFSLDVPPMQAFSFADYFSRLLTAHPGHFRLFVLTVSSSSYRFWRESLSAADAQSYVSNGSPSLVGPVRNVPVHEGFTCLALVYEFVKASAATQPELSASPVVSARDHLQLAGIWSKL